MTFYIFWQNRVTGNNWVVEVICVVEKDGYSSIRKHGSRLYQRTTFPPKIGGAQQDRYSSGREDESRLYQLSNVSYSVVDAEQARIAWLIENVYSGIEQCKYTHNVL